MRAKNFVVNRGISCVIRGILSCVIRCNPVFQSWSSRRERVNECLVLRQLSFMKLINDLYQIDI